MPEFQYTEAEFEQLLNNVYNGAITPDNLPFDLYLATQLYLSEAIDRVFNKGIDLDVGSPDFDLYRHYQHNIAVFSGAKTYHQAKDMSSKVFTKSGYKKEFREFEKEAKQVFDMYNKNYLRTEFDTATTNAQMGTLWNDFEANAEALPYLRYVTAKDERVRDSHKAWDNITLPVSHPFWQTHTPANGWNCRCMLIQLGEDEYGEITSDELVNKLPDVDSKMFRSNPAKTKKIFDEEHPYFLFNEQHKRFAKNNFGFPTPSKPK